MFRYQTSVCSTDIDAAGIMFYANFFTFIHDAYEAFMDHQGMSILKIVSSEEWLLPIVHAEADYQKSLQGCEQITVELEIGEIGKHSFIMLYQLKDEKQALVATAKTVHVAVSKKTQKKIQLPDPLIEALTRA